LQTWLCILLPAEHSSLTLRFYLGVRRLNSTMNKLTTKAMILAAAAAITLGGFAVVAKAQGPGGFRGGRGGFLGGMMGTMLGLTDAQKDQIKAITKTAFDSNQALATQMKAAHEAEQAAIKADKSDAELAQLAQSYAALYTQFHTVLLQTEAKIYKVLTPEQRAKVSEMRSKMRSRFGEAMQQGFGGRHHGPPATQDQ
jgi:Spy/CpxP family protein refolding chaperone